MARPIGSGVTYFPLDVNLDDQYKLIEAQFGLEGFAIVIKLIQKIYGSGYYYMFTEDVKLLFAKENTVNINLIDEVLRCCIDRGIFNKELFDEYNILTSIEIQERYFEITKRRKNVIVKKEYLLLSVDELSNNVTLGGVNVDINSKNVDVSTQSKENKSKENESKENESKENESKENESKENESKENESNIVTVVVDFYEQNIGTISPTILSDINYYIKQGIEPDLIILCIKKSVDNNKRNWSYAKGILKNLQANGVNTVKQYESEEVSKNGNTSIYSSRDKPTRKLSGVTYL